MDLKFFINGGLASVVAESGTFFIDTTKTRLQLQGQIIDPSQTATRYRGMLHTMYIVSKTEGPLALYSGLSPALLRQAVYGTLKVGLYYSLKRVFIPNPDDETLFKNVCVGVFAGATANSIANPTDVLKVRLQAQNEHFKGKGLVRSFIQIAQTEGVRGLWRGVGPTSQRAAIVAGVEFPAYDISKKHLLSMPYFADNVKTHFVASVIAGFAGAVASNPIDVAKTRMMNQRNLKAVSASELRYTSAWHCLYQTFTTEGAYALYRGFIPNWLRLGPWNVVVRIPLYKYSGTY